MVAYFSEILNVVKYFIFLFNKRTFLDLYFVTIFRDFHFFVCSVAIIFLLFNVFFQRSHKQSLEVDVFRFSSLLNGLWGSVVQR